MLQSVQRAILPNFRTQDMDPIVRHHAGPSNNDNSRHSIAYHILTSTINTPPHQAPYLPYQLQSRSSFNPFSDSRLTRIFPKLQRRLDPMCPASRESSSVMSPNLSAYSTPSRLSSPSPTPTPIAVVHPVPSTRMSGRALCVSLLPSAFASAFYFSSQTYTIVIIG